MVRSRTPSRYWWVLAIAAGLSLLAGIIVLAAPKSSLETIALILGIYLVAIGINGFVTAFSDPEGRGGHRTLVLVMAIFAINLYLARPVLESLLFSLALAVGLTPEIRAAAEADMPPTSPPSTIGPLPGDGDA